MTLTFTKNSTDFARLDFPVQQVINTETSSSPYDETVVEEISFSKQLMDGKIEYGITIYNKDEQYDFHEEWTHSEFVDLIKEMAKLAKLELTEEKEK